MPSVESAPKKTGLGKSLLIVVGMTVFFFILLEGVSSAFLLVDDLARYSRRPLTERVHSRYDPLLGWVNLPGLDLRDVYGPGSRFRTNSRGFRNDRDFTVEVPSGKIRVVCLGDSFTMGYGVSNDEAWCQVLESLDGRVESVNMGQGGYGLDQAYLWYLRDGIRIRHDILLFSFITEDFLRVGRDNFLGYSKPVLKVQEGRLVPTHVPVPRRSYYFPWVRENAAIFIRLRSLELFRRLFDPAQEGQAHPPGPDIGKILETASMIFGDLQRSTRETGNVLVLVYLPVSQDYQARSSDPWREFVRREAERRGIPYVDLVAEFRKLPAGEAGHVFKDHYSVEGNRFVAKTILSRLMSLPAASERFSRAGDARSKADGSPAD